MKKSPNQKSIVLLFLFMITLSFSFAQPLAGLYTVGGVSPDYTTVAAASSAVQTNGISAPVIFNIRDGLYSGKIAMYQFAGSSPVNTVTFQSENSDSSLVIISDSTSTTAGSNYTVQLYGADYIIFNQVTIQRPGSGIYGNVLEVGNNSNGISLTNNRFIASNGTQVNAFKCLVYTDSLAKNDNCTITGNRFENGNYGIYKQSYTLETGNIITNNIFENQFVGGIYADRQEGINISRNTINSNGSASFRGIWLNRSVTGCTLNKNKIAATNGNAGIYFSLCNSAVGDDVISTNNFIQVGGTSNNSGINVINSAQIKIYHNSVNLNGTNALSSAIIVSGANTAGILLKNNVFCNSGIGYAINIPVATSLSGSDFNDLYTLGANLGSYNAILAPSLVDWQVISGRDSNSVFANPVFTSPTDLHSSSVGINDFGTGIGSVVTDIDGEARNPTNPDIGADEFTPLSDNISVKALLGPLDYACGDSNTTVTLVIQNLGINSASSIPVGVDITGTSTLTLTGTVNGPLASYATDTIILTGSWNTYAGGNFALNCYVAYSGDQNLLDDTLLVLRTIVGIPNPPVVVSPQNFCQGDIAITATTDSGNVLFWYNESSGGNLIFTGDTFSPGITTDTSFFVEAHSGSGGSGCLRITEIATDSPNGADYIEIQNCSAGPVDVTGWVVAVSNSYTDINLANTTLWDLTSLNSMAPGQIEYKTDGTINPWGGNIFWNPSSSSWAIIIDNAGNVVDYLAWGWTDAEIQSLNVTINNFPIAISNNWNGDGVNAACISPNSISRVGNTDNDDANDFNCAGGSLATLNAGLILPFSSCGASACGSDRVPVIVLLNPLPVVNLGNDTISGFPVLLDAGAGFVSYLWSTAATTQTITVNATGSYIVTITDANGCTALDSINYTSTVGLTELPSVNNLIIYPNPVNNILTLTFSLIKSQNFKINLINSLGKTVFTKAEQGGTGFYKTSIPVKMYAAGVYNLEIITDTGKLNKMILIE